MTIPTFIFNMGAILYPKWLPKWKQIFRWINLLIFITKIFFVNIWVIESLSTYILIMYNCIFYCTIIKNNYLILIIINFSELVCTVKQVNFESRGNFEHFTESLGGYDCFIFLISSYGWQADLRQGQWL